jgi:hypothetical protein
VLRVLRQFRALITGSGTAAELTPGETIIRDVVREVYTGSILSERVQRNGPDAMLTAELQHETLKNLTINLSSLARLHEQEGASLPAIRMSLRFD